MRRQNTAKTDDAVSEILGVIMMLAMAQGCGRREFLLSSEIIGGEKVLVLPFCEKPVCTSYLPEMQKQYEESQVIQVAAATWRGRWCIGRQH